MSMNILNLSLSKNKWNRVSDEIGNLSVGGRNWARKTDLLTWEVASEGEDEYGAYIRYRTFSTNNPFPSVSYEPNTQYTISCNSIDESGLGHPIFIIYYVDGTRSPLYYFSGKECTRFEITSDKDKSIDYIRLSYVHSQFVRVYNFKLEKGNKATDYTEAPEDINAHPISAPLSQISFLSKQTHSRVKELTNAVMSLGGSEL